MRKVSDFFAPLIGSCFYIYLILLWKADAYTLVSWWPLVWLIGTLYGISRATRWFLQYGADFDSKFVAAMIVIILPFYLWPVQLYEAIFHGSVKNIIIRWPVGQCLYDENTDRDVKEWIAVNYPSFWMRPLQASRVVHFFRENDQIMFVLSGLGKLP